MAIVEVFVPQMGEGLTEVRILELQKQPGDRVHRDELLYSMETDKATLDVEAPFEGVLVEWLTVSGDILAVGAPIARIDTEMADAAAMAHTTAMGGKASGGSTRNSTPEGAPKRAVVVPPRTRAYCREKGISEEEMSQIAAPTGKLMPADVDAYLAAKASPAAPTAISYTEYSLSAQQRTFAYRLRRSAQVVVAGTIRRPVAWSGVRDFVTAERNRGADPRPTEFQTFAYCVAQTVRDFPKFRSTLIGEEVVRESVHINLGIAVARPNDELTTAVIPQADTLDFATFLHKAKAGIYAARDGDDQIEADTQLLLTYLGATGIEDAIPVLVSPAIGILFLGAPFVQEGILKANLVLTFDHRLIYGIEAANFLNSLADRVAAWSGPPS
ncbi:MAG: Dihydrolipoamide acetyltransferase component of pyruvate dehydrogenase complex [Chthonomonadaceae bacterium]|nr:Dihydrolipoamide acetyltransferase component of pyruvate dehydrogenase complex [Chthonomonadaceae bacterium]